MMVCIELAGLLLASQFAESLNLETGSEVYAWVQFGEGVDTDVVVGEITFTTDPGEDGRTIAGAPRIVVFEYDQVFVDNVSSYFELVASGTSRNWVVKPIEENYQNAKEYVCLK